MNYKIISKKDLITTTWQGGTTTELYIYPEDSNYQERNFEFRLSSAQVNLEESQFTSLPNIDRELMVLDGSIEITHENQYSKRLNKFNVDSFKGDWKTSSKGTCTDFNLMSNVNYNCKIEVVTSSENQKKKLKNSSDFLILYNYKGEVLIKNENILFRLKEGDVFVLKEKMNLEISFSDTSELIISKIDTK
ncbi:HutD family protein [Flavobacterium sp.]|uniref:HutD family protein n=1 Tax=Flavobacterium sp. TaxID=239 RepID=UPI003D2D5E10